MRRHTIPALQLEVELENLLVLRKTSFLWGSALTSTSHGAVSPSNCTQCSRVNGTDTSSQIPEKSIGIPKEQKKPSFESLLLEAAPGFEPGMEVAASALPLSHAANL